MEDIGRAGDFRIPRAEYHALASAFNPIPDAESWVKLALDAGMKYMVFTQSTTMIAMYRSRYRNTTSPTQLPSAAVVRSCEACYKHGLKFGLYYSQPDS